jgi:hypothetical protein
MKNPTHLLVALALMLAIALALIVLMAACQVPLR